MFTNYGKNNKDNLKKVRFFTEHTFFIAIHLFIIVAIKFL